MWLMLDNIEPPCLRRFPRNRLLVEAAGILWGTAIIYRSFRAYVSWHILRGLVCLSRCYVCSIQRARWPPPHSEASPGERVGGFIVLLAEMEQLHKRCAIKSMERLPTTSPSPSAVHTQLLLSNPFFTRNVCVRHRINPEKCVYFCLGFLCSAALCNMTPTLTPQDSLDVTFNLSDLKVCHKPACIVVVYIVCCVFHLIFVRRG